MTNIWFTSDTHFSHGNFLKFRDNDGNLIRQFEDVKTMDEYIVHKWNSVVKNGDKVYHLGDVTFNYNKFEQSIGPKLHGQKRLVIGNHDELGNRILQKFFRKVTMWRVFKEEGFVASHVPLREDQFRHKVALSLHGHIHQNLIDSPNYFNVCVEHHDYTPVHIDDIVVAARKAKEIRDSGRVREDAQEAVQTS